MLRDKLIARLAEMGDPPDHQRLVAEVLGIRGVAPDLARRLVAQALVLEDRREEWRRVGQRICRDAPSSPGVYVLRNPEGRPMYVGKAVNLHRRLHAHFSARRWRTLKPEMARVADAEWHEVGSELEALLREASLIHELQPSANVQIAPPALATREIPRALVRDVIVIVPSVETGSAELVAARTDGGWMIQRTRRSGADLGAHARRLKEFFKPAHDWRQSASKCPLAPIVFSWLAGRGTGATRVDGADARSSRALRAQLAALLADEELFVDRLMVYSSFRPTS